MQEIFILSAICALIATTISESSLFRSFRLWAKKCNHYVGAGVGCGYCCGHWVAFALTIIYRPRIVHSKYIILDYLVTAFFIAWLSAYQWAVLNFLVKLSGHELNKPINPPTP